MTTIVLAHGIARFDALLVALGRTTGVYFNGIADHLRAHGFKDVVEPVVPFADSVGVRSEALGKAIFALNRPVHIIAHSMGGLDARHMIVGHQDAGGLVKSLTTIGTPHRGTSFADFGLAHGGSDFIEVVRRATTMPSIEGFRDLTTGACRVFNEEARGAEAENRVTYRVVTASEDFATTFEPLKISYPIIKAHEGENDGLVSVSSQRWTDTGMLGKKRVREIRFPLPADHLNEVGWWDPAEAAALSLSRVLPNLYMDRVKDFYLDLARLAVSKE
jgi:triacylglycerol lipase